MPDDTTAKTPNFDKLSLEERSRRVGPSSPFYRPAIVVKFRDSVEFPSYSDGVEKELVKQGIGDWEAVSKLLQQKGTFLRLYQTLTPAQIEEAVKQAIARNPKYKPPNFLNYFVLDCPPESPWFRVVELLRTWKNHVETAYVAPEVVDPQVNYLANKDSQYQSYLDPGPMGIDARFATSLPGGDGAEQEFVDLEGGWSLDQSGVVDHVDLAVHNARLVYGLNVNSSCSHGTSVLGVVCAADNNLLGVGITPKLAAVNVVSHSAAAKNIPEAIEKGIAKLSPGVVLLLEVSLRRVEDGRTLPAETDPATFAAIEKATAAGFVVVEAAGNGNQDLDRYQDADGNSSLRRNNQGFRERDSGAILVGAAWRAKAVPGAATPWSRRIGSNYGSGIDCFAWGDSVYTTDSTSTNPKGDYTANFNGTSSAAAIIAGAALSVQGLAQNQHGMRLAPERLRELLRNATTGGLANTPTANPSQDLIGVMPNLRAIQPQLQELPVTDLLT